MVAFIVRRLLAAILLVLVIAFVTYAIFFLVPQVAGLTPYDLAARYVGKTANPATIHARMVKLHLNEPFIVQYFDFIRDLVFGAHYDAGAEQNYCPPPCFGYSFVYQTPVWPQLASRIPVTLELAAGASVLWLVGGVTIGVISALRRGRPVDRVSMGIALAGVSLPVFFTAILSQSQIRDRFQIFTGAGGQWVPMHADPMQWLSNMILPWLTLAFLQAALYARLTRAGMLETMGEDYIRTARAKGLPERTVIARHALRATMVPIITIFGLDLGTLLGGAVLTETAWTLPGLGQYAILSIGDNDLPAVLGVVMVGAIFIVVANLVVDILYAVADPRVRLAN
ncbi:MAG TPA: ABC transporter permease [Streptosporangiaceae bacterium]|nr:ABC transporter permease [Streptosporangiaceae bacterium]